MSSKITFIDAMLTTALKPVQLAKQHLAPEYIKYSLPFGPNQRSRRYYGIGDTRCHRR
jgi:hypothetical protein